MIFFKDNKLFLNDKILELDHPIYKVWVYKKYVFLLYDPDCMDGKGEIFKNLLAFTKDGEKLWTADNPKWAQQFPYYEVKIKRGYFISEG